MNRYFKDARYHTKRAGESLKMGVRLELEPLMKRARETTGREEEPEPSRIDELRDDVMRMERSAERKARRTANRARSRIARR